MAIDLPTAVLAFVTALESVSGVQIAVLERRDKTEDFWARSAAILCEKTKEAWCSENVRFMTANTEPMGQSHIIEYDFQGKGLKRVCAIIPPMPDIHPSFLAESYGTGIPTIFQMPSSAEAAAWLMIYHASHCLDSQLTELEENRAVAMATLGLSLIGGDYTFLPGRVQSSARMLAVMTGKASAYWAAGTGERILLDLWKQEAATRLRREASCYVTVSGGTTIDTERIKRDQNIRDGQNCAASTDERYRTNPEANITDANLWLWLYGPQGGEIKWPKVGVPPMAYHAMKPFKDMNTAASYILETSNSLAKQ